MSEPNSRLLLVRHGETADNKRGVFQGQEGSTLNDRGRDQARRLGERLARTVPSIAAVYASDLVRAKETAEIIAGLHPKALTVELDEGLREIFLGAWQGLSLAQISARFPEEWAAWQRGQEDLRRGGGETYGELAERMVRSMARIAEAHPGETVLVVSHGAAIKTFGGAVLGMAPGSAKWLRALRVPDNTGLAIIEREGADFRVTSWNETAHLADDRGG